MAEQSMIPGEAGGIGGIDGESHAEAVAECPLRRVLAIRENGLVLESTRSFEVGSTMMIGCHVDRCETGVVGGFFSAEVIVVDSRERVAGEDRHQLMVLFSEISSEEREMLLALPDVGGIRISPSRSRSGNDDASPRAGLAIPPPEVFPISQLGDPQAGPSADSRAKVLKGNGGASEARGCEAGDQRIGRVGFSLN